MKFDSMAWSPIQWHEVRSNGMKSDPMAWSSIQWHEVRSNGMKFDPMAWSPIQWHEKYGPIEWHTIQWHEKYCRIERCLIQWQSIDDPRAWNVILWHFCPNSPSIKFAIRVLLAQSSPLSVPKVNQSPSGKSNCWPIKSMDCSKFPNVYESCMR